MANRQEIIMELKKRGYNGPLPGMAQEPVQFPGGQASTYGSANIPKGMEGRMNPGANVPQPAPQASPIDTGSQTINDLILKTAKPNYTVRQNIGDAISVLGGGKANYLRHENDNDYSKLYMQEAIKKQLNPYDDQLKQAQAEQALATAEAMKNPAPPGFIQVGGKFEKDPTYKDPNAPLPPSIENRKIKATDAIYDTVGQANVNYDRIQRGMEAAPKLPQGMLGKAQTWWMKAFDGDNPTLGDWQNMKSLLQDAQLQKTAKTKGAISDREMAMFAEAVANDDFASVVRQQNVLDAFKKSIFADQQSKIGAFKRSFNEDPMEWGDLGAQNPYAEQPNDDPLGIL